MRPPTGSWITILGRSDAIVLTLNDFVVPFISSLQIESTFLGCMPVPCLVSMLNESNINNTLWQTHTPLTNDRRTRTRGPIALSSLLFPFPLHTQ